MPLELQPGEQVFFPQPFIPTEHHPLVITNRRVLQYAPMGAYPIAEFEVGKIEFIGRMSERPLIGLTVVVGIVAFILFIVGAAKVLPPTLFAEAPRSSSDEAELTEDGRLVEGKDADDEYPFYDKEVDKGSLRRKLQKLKKLSQISPRLPPLTGDVIWGLVSLVAAVALALLARRLYRKEDFFIFCRVADQVYRLCLASEAEQMQVLSTLQAAQQAAAPR
ncbi:MAG: hypothetical protein RMK29_18195 [Myxococcales bacterium]|nr:hypothetical protein [Myxococcota bacterium]MDW8283643.1 hypothetical protein [Myxococcales bacterium]